MMQQLPLTPQATHHITYPVAYLFHIPHFEQQSRTDPLSPGSSYSDRESQTEYRQMSCSEGHQ